MNFNNIEKFRIFTIRTTVWMVSLNENILDKLEGMRAEDIHKVHLIPVGYKKINQHMDRLINIIETKRQENKNIKLIINIIGKPDERVLKCAQFIKEDYETLYHKSDVVKIFKEDHIIISRGFLVHMVRRDPKTKDLFLNTGWYDLEFIPTTIHGRQGMVKKEGLKQKGSIRFKSHS